MAASPYSDDRHTYVWSEQQDAYFYILGNGKPVECPFAGIDGESALRLIRRFGLVPSNADMSLHQIDTEWILAEGAVLWFTPSGRVLAVHADDYYNHQAWFNIDWDADENNLRADPPPTGA